MQRWVTVHTKPNAEGRAFVAIYNSGWDVFCPFEMVRYIDRGLVCKKPVALFGPYMFVFMDPERMSHLIGMDGVECVLRDDNGHPRYANTERIDALRRDHRMGANDRAGGNWAAAGDEVRIADSPFKGLTAKIKNAPRHKRVELVMDDTSFRITAPVDKLEKIRA